MKIIKRQRESEIKDAIAAAHNKMACGAEAFVGATHSDTREDPYNRTAFLDRTSGYLAQSIQSGEKALAWIKELQAKARETDERGAGGYTYTRDDGEAIRAQIFVAEGMGADELSVKINGQTETHTLLAARRIVAEMEHRGILLPMPDTASDKFRRKLANRVDEIRRACPTTSRDKNGNRVFEVYTHSADNHLNMLAAMQLALESAADFVVLHLHGGKSLRLSVESAAPVSIPTMQYGITPDKATDVFGRPIPSDKSAQPKSTDSQGNPATSVYANGKPMPGSEPRQVETNAEKVQDNGIYYALTIYTADDGVKIRKALKAADKHGDDDIVVYLREGKHLMSVSAAREVVARLDRIGMLPPEGEGE